MRRLAHLALVAFVFCLGLAAGAWFFIGRRAAAFGAGVEQRFAQDAATTPAHLLQVKRELSSDEEMLTAIMSAVAENEPLLRAHRLLDLLGHLDSAQFAVLFGRAVRVDDRDRRDAVLGALLARWTAIDPAGATAAVRPYRDRVRANEGSGERSVEWAVYRAWAQALPDTAFAEAMAAPSAPWAWETASAAMKSLAGGDPARQLDALARQPASSLRAEMCEAAIVSLAEQDSDAAEAGLDLLPEPRQWARVQSEILGKLAARDPSAALARLAALAPDLASGMKGARPVTAVLRTAARRDPEGALAALDGLPEDLRTYALGAALVGWADEHPVDALTWATANGVDVAGTKAIKFDDDYGDTSRYPLLGTALASDRAKTLDWLCAQPASRERDAMLNEAMSCTIWRGMPEEMIALYAELTPESRPAASGTVVQSLSDESAELAEPWVKALPPGPARAAAVETLVRYQARKAPERIDTLADAWPAGSERDAALRGLVEELGQTEPRRALDFARRTADPAARDAVFERIADLWFYGDQTAARAWVASAPELSAEQKRVLLRRFDER